MKTISQKEVREIMSDLRGLRAVANKVGDLADALGEVQRKGYPEAFFELEEAVDEYIGGLESAGVILLLGYLLWQKQPVTEG